MNDAVPLVAPVARGPLGLASHPLRAAVLGEIHARPFQLVATPRVILQLAFLTEENGVTRDLAVLSDLSRSRGRSGPDADARHFALDWDTGRLRWERHTEFSAWSWDTPAPRRFEDPLVSHPFGESFEAPGRLISAIRLDLRFGSEANEGVAAAFDPTSLCFSEVDGGLARAATDFRQDAQGFTRILVLDLGLGPARAGALAQRLIEIETYRTLALLGLPLAQSLAPEVRGIEEKLAAVTGRLREDDGSDSHKLLDVIIALAADLEAGAAASLYRFGASRAYDEIVSERLASIGERPISGFETWTAFLGRRLAPAMRTCRAMEERQANLSRKLARAADLLRTRVDVELEQQNRDLLRSMDRRANLQLRLQQTVEGLSVAAVSYYVVGLLSYLAEGLPEGGRIPPAALLAASVPVVVLAVWWTVRRVRRAHGEP